MKKNVAKILLDLVMMAMLVQMYNSHAVNLTSHETAGLCLFGLVEESPA